MIHDHPETGQLLDWSDDEPVRQRNKSGRGFWLLIGLLLAAAIAAATWLPTLDLDRLASYLSPRPEIQVGAVSEAKKRELLAATQDMSEPLKAEGLEAEQINEAMPLSTLPIEKAKPFFLAGSAPAGATALQCLTQAIYYEAGFESELGKYAVAQVIINRARHPAFAKSVCGVVYQGSTRPGCQFSFTCDGSLLRKPEAGAWAEARRIASVVLSGGVTPAVGMATHYHANYVSPYWAPKLVKITKIGAHIFYRWPGNWGRPAAFTGIYTGREFIPAFSTLANINAATVQEGDLGMPVIADMPRDVTDRRADNDLGGRIDTAKEWRLNIPAPSETRGAFQALADKQQTAEVAPEAAE